MKPKPHKWVKIHYRSGEIGGNNSFDHYFEVCLQKQEWGVRVFKPTTCFPGDRVIVGDTVVTLGDVAVEQPKYTDFFRAGSSGEGWTRWHHHQDACDVSERERVALLRTPPPPLPR